MSPYEQDDIRHILNRIYSPEIAGRWEVNERVAETLLEMSSELSNCSKLMDLVPRPMPPGSRPLRYLSKEARKALMRQLKDDETYISCVKIGATAYRSQFEAASLGL